MSKFDKVSAPAAKMFHGKSIRPGGGGAFAKLESKLESKGKSEGSAKAIAASVGRAKYGPKKMAKFASTGKKRANK